MFDVMDACDRRCRTRWPMLSWSSRPCWSSSPSFSCRGGCSSCSGGKRSLQNSSHMVVVEKQTVHPSSPTEGDENHDGGGGGGLWRSKRRGTRSSSHCKADLEGWPTESTNGEMVTRCHCTGVSDEIPLEIVTKVPWMQGKSAAGKFFAHVPIPPFFLLSNLGMRPLYCQHHLAISRSAQSKRFNPEVQGVMPRYEPNAARTQHLRKIGESQWRGN